MSGESLWNGFTDANSNGDGHGCGIGNAHSNGDGTHSYSKCSTLAHGNTNIDAV